MERPPDQHGGDGPAAPARAKWHSRVEYACARCEYDVTTSLADGKSVCPECGSPISEQRCGRSLRGINGWARAALCMVWMSPVVVVPMGTYFLTTWFLEWVVHSPSPIARSIANQNVDDGVIAWIIFAGLAVATEAMCFVMWRRVERWRHRRGATRRALWRTGIVVAIQVGAVASIIGALLAINEYWR